MFAVGLTSLGGKFVSSLCDQVLGVIFNGQVVEDLYARQVSRFFLQLCNKNVILLHSPTFSFFV